VAERFAEALETSGVDVVPKVQIDGGAAGGGSSGLLQALMTLVMSDKLGLPLGTEPAAAGAAEKEGEEQAA
jgi:hypothetical protein